MRFIVLGLAILGAIGGASLGSKWISDAQGYSELTSQIEKLGKSTGNTKLQEQLDKVNSLVRTGWILCIAAVTGVAIGVLLVLKKLPAKPAAVGLALCSLLPGLLYMASIFFSIGFLLASGLCFWKVKDEAVTAHSTEKFATIQS